MHGPPPPPVVAPPLVAPPRAAVQPGSDVMAQTSGHLASQRLLDRLSRIAAIAAACLMIGLVGVHASLLVRHQLQSPVAASLDNGQQSSASDSTQPQVAVSEPVSASIVSWRPSNESGLGSGGPLKAEPTTISVGLRETDPRTAPTGLAVHALEPVLESMVDANPSGRATAVNASDFAIDKPTKSAAAIASDKTLSPVENIIQDSKSPAAIQADGSQVIASLEILPSPEQAVHAVCEDGTCRAKMESHGTTLKWADSPADAYRMASEQNKLVFLIHVSGNFEIPGFT